MGVPERMASVTGELLSAVGRVRGQGHPSFLGEGGDQVMDGGYLQPQAGQRSRVRRVRMHNPTHVRLRTVETRVHGNLAGRLQGSFQNLAVEGHEHDVLRFQDLVFKAAWGYQDVPLGGTSADVARSRVHEAR